MNTKLIKAKDLFNLGNSLRDNGKLDDAVKNYKKAIELNPNYSLAYNNLGVVLIKLSKTKEAINNFQKAINILPVNTKAYLNLSYSITFSSKSLEIKKMEEMISEKRISILNKIDLAFALGKAYEDLKQYDKAFAYWELGNNNFRNSYKYTIEEDNTLFQNLKHSFNENIFSELKSSQDNDSTPIFIVGLPRSGSTLAEQILSNHSEVYGAGEIPFLQNLIKKYFISADNIPEKDKKKYLEKNFKIIGKTYLSQIKKKSLNAKRVTDKFPYNFKYIGIIKILFPNAKIVHCTRNLQDNCLSIFKTKFVNTNENKWSYSLKEIISYYKMYENLMDYWKKIIPNYIYDLSYEKLINNNLEEIKNLSTFCKLNWEENLTKFYQNKRSVDTASVLQVRKPIYKTSVDYWKNFEKKLIQFF